MSNDLKQAATSVKELEDAIGEAIKELENNTGLIVSNIITKTTGFNFEGNQRVVGVKLEIRV